MTRTISPEFLRDLEGRIDSAIPEAALAKIPRNVALVHLLRVFEDWSRGLLPKMIGYDPTNGMREGLKIGQDALHFAALWIHKHCAPDTASSRFGTTNLDVYKLILETLLAAMNYSGVWDYMNYIHRNWAKIEIVSDNELHLSFPLGDISSCEVADTILGAPDGPDVMGQAAAIFSKLDWRNVIKDVRPRDAGGGRVAYSLSPGYFRTKRSKLGSIIDHLWTLDPSWDLGGYTVGEFREIWRSLITSCLLHSLICMKSEVAEGARESVIRVKSKSAWANELSRQSQVEYRKVLIILSDLTFDFGLYGRKGVKDPDVTYQPFFSVGNSELALSNQLVVLSNAERNIWDLVSILRPEVHGDLKNLKESVQLEELRSQLSGSGIEVFGPLKFTMDGKPGDLDALLLDERNGFGLACQLKWLVEPDRIKDVVYACKELQKGLDQADRSLQWLKANFVDVARRIDWKGRDLASFQFEGAVISRQFMGGGRVENPQIPILSERLVNWVLVKPHRRSLQTLWRVGCEKRYLPKLGKHYIEADVGVEFAGVKFVGKNFGMGYEQDWKPEVDIDFTGL